MSQQITPFESFRRTNPAGNEFWSSRDFAKVLDYADYRNFQSVIESARTACFNSGSGWKTISLRSPKWSKSAKAQGDRQRP
jgi:hypothetical protein